jgi:hypothetical protein
MASGDAVRLVALIDELIALFNRRSLDVPERLFSRDTQFVLNGLPFETRLGRPADPLVLMLARGAAGYRFTAKAVQHAMPDAVLQRGELDDPMAAGVRTVSGRAWLSGHLRERGEPVEAVVDVSMDVAGVTAKRIAVTLKEEDLIRLQEARMRT